MMHRTRSSSLKEQKEEKRLSQMVFRIKLRDEDSHKVAKAPVKRRRSGNNCKVAPKTNIRRNTSLGKFDESALDLGESMLVTASDTSSIRMTLGVPKQRQLFSPIQQLRKNSVRITKVKPSEAPISQKASTRMLKSKQSKGPIATSTPVPLPVKARKLKHKKVQKCKICNAKFKFSSILKFHLERHKSEENNDRFGHKQTPQQESIPTNPISRNSLGLRSPSNFVFKCRNCSKCFCSKYNLMCHRFTHVGKTKLTLRSRRRSDSQDIKIKEILIHNVRFRQEGLNEGDLPFCGICKITYPSEDENVIDSTVRHSEETQTKSVPKSDLGWLKPIWMQHILPVNKRLFSRDD